MTVRADPYLVMRVLPHRLELQAPVIVMVQLEGSCVVSQDNREAVVHRGDLVLLDAARSYRVFYPSGNHTHVALRVPRELLERSLLTLADVTAVTVSGTSGMGAAVGPLLAGLHAALPALDATAGRHLVGHAIDLVASTFFLDDPGNSDERRARLLHAQRFIRASLADDNLSPATVADALNMSVGHLHRLFRGTGMTVGQTIRQARLERCAAELRETAHGAETVSEIAFRHGFKDAAHFTRAFTRRYGVPPSQWRNAGTMPAG